MSDEIDFNAVLDALDLERPDRTGKISCPFHDEHTASCHVYPDGHFHCYGCGARGDAIAFVTRKLGCTYGRALRFIAQQTDIDMDDVKAAVARAAGPQRIVEYEDLTDRFMSESVALVPMMPMEDGRLSTRKAGWIDDALVFAAKRWGIGFEPLHAFGVRAAANALWIPHYHPDGRVVGVKVRNTSTGDKISMKGSRFGAQLYRRRNHLYLTYAFVVEGEPDTWKADAHFAQTRVIVYGLPGGASTLRQEWADELAAKHSHITLCFDNDAAGESARNRFAEMLSRAVMTPARVGPIPYLVHVRPQGGKDFTEAYNAGWRP